MSVSGVSGSGSSSSTNTGVAPSNLGTISFTGLGSGFNYSQIIQQLTAISQRQLIPYQNKITNINAQNTELSTIQGLLSTLQGSLKALSDPNTFDSYTATPSNTAVLSATQQPGTTPIPGIYTVTATTLGTATKVTGLTSIGHSMSDNIAVATPSTTVALASSYAQISPTNGSSGSGIVTVDGVKISYDVSSQSLTTILANIQSAVRASADATFVASYNAGTDKVTFSSTAKPISYGATADSGNLLAVLKLDVGALTNTASSGTVTSASGVGGVNQYTNLTNTNALGYTVNSNFVTPVTAGNFTINGVSISVNPATQSLSDVIKKINTSGAGVTATFDAVNGNLSLYNKTVGAQSIVVGAASDTSNFLTATALKTGTTSLGTQSSLSYTDTAGTPRTVYSNTNTITNAIPGFSLSLLSTSSTNSTLTVAQSATQAETSIANFVSSYNAVVNELNIALAPPVVSQNGKKAQSVGGGIFFGNTIIGQLKNSLVNLVTSVQSNTTSGYNSLAAVGLKLNSTFQVLTSGKSTGTSVSGTTNTSTGGIGITTYQGTDGAFVPLDKAAFEAAFANNPTAIKNLFTNSANVVNQLGSYLTNETGYSTILANSIAGTAPKLSPLAGLTSQNKAVAASSQARIDAIQKQITNQANILNIQFSAASQRILGLQSQQAYLSSIGGSSSSGSSSTPAGG